MFTRTRAAACRLSFDNGVGGLAAWKAAFTAPRDQWPKTVSEVILDLKADGNTLTGTAHMGNWPGEMPLMNGKIEGDRISFVVVGRFSWSAFGPGIDASGMPRIAFTGTIRGSKIQLNLFWDSVMIRGTDPGVAREYEMVGEKVEKAPE